MKRAKILTTTINQVLVKTPYYLEDSVNIGIYDLDGGKTLLNKSKVEIVDNDPKKSMMEILLSKSTAMSHYLI